MCPAKFCVGVRHSVVELPDFDTSASTVQEGSLPPPIPRRKGPETLGTYLTFRRGSLGSARKKGRILKCLWLVLYTFSQPYPPSISSQTKLRLAVPTTRTCEHISNIVTSWILSVRSVSAASYSITNIKRLGLTSDSGTRAVVICVVLLDAKRFALTSSTVPTRMATKKIGCSLFP